MADTNIVRLTGRQAPGPRRSDGGLVVLGLPFAGAGAFLLALAVQADPATGSQPGLLASTGALFASAGLLLVVRGVRAVRAVVRRGRTLRAHPGEPWLADGWDPRGYRERPLKPALVSLALIGLLLLALAPINWAASRLPIAARAAVGLTDLVVFAGLGLWVYRLAHSVRYRSVRARFERFPFFLGQMLEVALESGGAFQRLEHLDVTLRHIRVESKRVSRERHAVFYQDWAETQAFGSARLQVPGALRVAFALPAGDLATRLGEERLGQTPPRYWELELTGRAPGLDLHVLVPVPVYAEA